jgi:hypothetical protein
MREAYWQDHETFRARERKVKACERLIAECKNRLRVFSEVIVANANWWCNEKRNVPGQRLLLWDFDSDVVRAWMNEKEAGDKAVSKRLEKE